MLDGSCQANSSLSLSLSRWRNFVASQGLVQRLYTSRLVALSSLLKRWNVVWGEVEQVGHLSSMFSSIRWRYEFNFLLISGGRLFRTLFGIWFSMTFWTAEVWRFLMAFLYCFRGCWFCDVWLDISFVGKQGGFHQPRRGWLVKVFIAWVFW